MDPFILLLVFLVGIIASYIGTNAGGGGLISIPAMIFLGLPAQMAIATNKVGALGMTTGFYKYHKERKIDYSVAIPVAIFGINGIID